MSQITKWGNVPLSAFRLDIPVSQILIFLNFSYTSLVMPVWLWALWLVGKQVKLTSSYFYWEIKWSMEISCLWALVSFCPCWASFCVWCSWCWQTSTQHRLIRGLPRGLVHTCLSQSVFLSCTKKLFKSYSTKSYWTILCITCADYYHSNECSRGTFHECDFCYEEHSQNIESFI